MVEITIRRDRIIRMAVELLREELDFTYRAERDAGGRVVRGNFKVDSDLATVRRIKEDADA